MMTKELFYVGDRIKALRESANMTQSQIAKTFKLSRSAVNYWELGLAVPSTQYIVELAKLFRVSTDYLLGMSDNSTISVEGLSEKQVTAVLAVSFLSEVWRIRSAQRSRCGYPVPTWQYFRPKAL